jgi:ABC-type transport system involved in cytochrome c biogenesis permease subunit
MNVNVLQASDDSNFSYKMMPVAYNGRFIPLDVYAKLELQKIYGKHSLKAAALPEFPHLSDNSALSFFINYYVNGHSPFDKSPLFTIHYAELKKILGLNPLKTHFSYNDLQQAIFTNQTSNLKLMQLLIPYLYLNNKKEMPLKSSKQEIHQLAKHLFVNVKEGKLIVLEAPNMPPWHFLKPGLILSDNFANAASLKLVVDEALTLLSTMGQYRNFEGVSKLENTGIENAFQKLKHHHVEQKEIAQILEREFPLFKRIQESGNYLKALPLKKIGDFVSLDALKQKVYDVKTNSLEYVNNFTLFQDAEFKEIQKAYLDLQTGENYIEKFINLANLLNTGYNTIAGKPSTVAFEKTLYYPTKNHLKAEYFYYHYPLIKLTILIYAIALIVSICAINLKKNSMFMASLGLMAVAFIMHSFILALRCYILSRPPVSNMFETVIYVPWIAMIAGFLFYFSQKAKSVILSACVLSVSLLILLEITGMNEQLENVQAVLDSQYWLIVHVLLIVGSYGVFFLCGLIGQSYLVQYFFKKYETKEMQFKGQTVLNLMYLGCLMLIPGTILGGVWAAESWGRFWDWDPKESWAFISSCIYLIFIHAFRFKKISTFGLCVGSVMGLLSISFTWYGVNYVLGTGLHSYGFGSGGEAYYYIFLLFQITFLILVSYKHKNILEMKNANMV